MMYQEIKKWCADHKQYFYASFELTQNCNFNCKHCYCPDKKRGTLSLDEAKLIVDKIFEAGCLQLVFTGGEIFTYKHFKELYLYAKKKGFLIDLMSNASIIDDEVIALLKEYPPRNISVTVYGTNESEYEQFTGDASNYAKTMRALQLLKENNIPFNIRTIAGKTLAKSIADNTFDRLAEQLGVEFRYDPIVFPKVSGEKSPLNESLSPEEIVRLESLNALRSASWTECVNSTDPFEWKCKAGVSSFFVDYKGDAYVCGMYRKNGISLLKEELQTVLKHLQKIHEEHECTMKNSQCSSCKMRKLCKWCPAYAHVYNGNETEKVTFFCDLAKARSEQFGNV